MPRAVRAGDEVEARVLREQRLAREREPEVDVLLAEDPRGLVELLVDEHVRRAQGRHTSRRSSASDTASSRSARGPRRSRGRSPGRPPSASVPRPLRDGVTSPRAAQRPVRPRPPPRAALLARCRLARRRPSRGCRRRRCGSLVAEQIGDGERRAGVLVALVHQAGVERQAGELGERPALPPDHVDFACESRALADEVERSALVTAIASDRAECAGGLGLAPYVLVFGDGSRRSP